MDLISSIPKLRIEKPQCYQHRGFSFVLNLFYLLAYQHYSICRIKLQYTFSKKFRAIQAASAPRAAWVANQGVDSLFLVFLLSFLLPLSLMHLHICYHYLIIFFISLLLGFLLVPFVHSRFPLMI